MHFGLQHSPDVTEIAFLSDKFQRLRDYFISQVFVLTKRDCLTFYYKVWCLRHTSKLPKDLGPNSAVAACKKMIIKDAHQRAHPARSVGPRKISIKMQI